MKKIIFIISILTIVSCSSENQEAEIESGTIEREGIEQTIGNDFFEAEKTTQEVGFKIYEIRTGIVPILKTSKKLIRK